MLTTPVMGSAQAYLLEVYVSCGAQSTAAVPTSIRSLSETNRAL